MYQTKHEFLGWCCCEDDNYTIVKEYCMKEGCIKYRIFSEWEIPDAWCLEDNPKSWEHIQESYNSGKGRCNHEKCMEVRNVSLEVEFTSCENCTEPICKDHRDLIGIEHETGVECKKCLNKL